MAWFGVIAFVFVIGTIWYLIVNALPLLILMVLGGVGAAFYLLNYRHYQSAVRRHDAAAARLRALRLPSALELRDEIMAAYEAELLRRQLFPPVRSVFEALERLAADLVTRERFEARLKPTTYPELKFSFNAEYADRALDALESALDAVPDARKSFVATTADMLATFTSTLPYAAISEWEDFRARVDAPTGFLAVPACDVVAGGKWLPDKLGSMLWDASAGALEAERAKYTENVQTVSAKLVSVRDFERGERVYPYTYPGTPLETATAYFKGMAWLDALTTPVPFAFEEARFQHQWIVAPTGMGKTQLLKAQIAADLPRVARGEASIVVMDSQGTRPGTLIGDLIRLKLFAPGEALHGRLVFLDPDPAYPLALNLFDFGLDATRGLSERDRRSYLTSVIDLAEFIINGLVGAEQTPMMKGISRFIIQALMAIPDATIRTFQEFMRKGGWQKYREYIDTLDDYTKEFFHTRFDTDQYAATKHGIFWRIDTMMADPTFREMFLNPRNRLDLARELGAAKVIVINTDRELLKADGTEAFGRFIIAKLLLATQGRASEPNPMTTYVYLDEAHDYIHSEDRIADLIDKARKQKVGLVFAHQRLANIKSANVLDALANTAVQFAGGNKSDATALARSLHTDPAFIENQPRLHFAAYVRGQTDHAVQVRVPAGLMEAMPKMTSKEEAEMRDYMHQRYSVDRSTSGSLSAPASGSDIRADAPTKWDT